MVWMVVEPTGQFSQPVIRKWAWCGTGLVEGSQYHQYPRLGNGMSLTIEPSLIRVSVVCIVDHPGRENYFFTLTGAETQEAGESELRPKFG